MYRLTASSSARRLVTEQLPTLIGAMVISEVLYKFHSFTLECVAFLATWFALDAICSLVWRATPAVTETPTTPTTGR